MIKLYKKDNTGQIREWSIWYDEDELVIFHGVHGGTLTEKREKVVVKGSNTLTEQIQSRIASRCKSKRDKGYLASLATVQLQDKAKNALGLKMPMLAHKKKDHKGKIEEWWTQFKYNGHRCLVTNLNGTLFAYSRNGLHIKTIQHILDDIHIPVGATIDGELYIHGFSLQKISSIVKRDHVHDLGLKIKYMVYDVMLNHPYGKRIGWLQDNVQHLLVPTTFMGNYDAGAFKAAKSVGYEGLIVRHGSLGYEDGKRSKSLLKIKAVDDDEFEVVDIIPSADGWARLVCKFYNGKTFRVSAPGTMPEKYKVMINKELWIGRKVNVEWAELTDEGLPFHPIATMWRDKEAE